MVQNVSVFYRSLLKCRCRFMVQAGKDIQQLTLALLPLDLFGVTACSAYPLLTNEPLAAQKPARSRLSPRLFPLSPKSV